MFQRGSSLTAIGEAVRDQAQRRARGVDIGAARDVLLEHVVLDRPGERTGAGALLLPGHLVEQEQHRGGRVDRHRRGHLAERDAVEQAAHVLDRVDRDPHLADLAVRDRGVGVVPHLSRQIEGDRQAGRPGLDQLLKAPVRLRGAGEPGVLAHRPGPFRVHRRVDATGIGIRSGLAQLLFGAEICKLSFVVNGFDGQSRFRHARHRHRLRRRAGFGAGGRLAFGADRRGPAAPRRSTTAETRRGDRGTASGNNENGASGWTRREIGDGAYPRGSVRGRSPPRGVLGDRSGGAELARPGPAARRGLPAGEHPGHAASDPPQPSRRHWAARPSRPSSRRRPRPCCVRPARPRRRATRPRWAARSWPGAAWWRMPRPHGCRRCPRRRT